jgi:hypothetical protein
MHNYPNCLNNSVDRWAVVAYGAINLKLKALIEKSTSFRPEQIERVSRCLIPSFNCVVNLSFSKLKKPTASETFCIRYSEGCIQLSLPLSLSLSLSLSFSGKWGTRRRTTQPPTATPPAGTLLLPIPASTLRARKSSPTTALASTKPRHTLPFSLYPSSILLSFSSLLFYFSVLSGIFAKE